MPHRGRILEVFSERGLTDRPTAFAPQRSAEASDGFDTPELIGAPLQGIL